eukprot:gene9809-8735_t
MSKSTQVVRLRLPYAATPPWHYCKIIDGDAGLYRSPEAKGQRLRNLIPQVSYLMTYL